MQSHRVIHKEARVHQQQILQQGQDQTDLEVNQALILEDSLEIWTLGEMKAGEEDRASRMI